MKIQRLHSCVAMLAVTGALWTVSASSTPVDGPFDRGTLVRTVRTSTARFHDVENAKAAGYGLFLGCVSGDDGGAMGVHYVNGDLVGDPTLDAAHPEAVMYETLGGRQVLVAVEYVVLADDWNAANPAPPVLMGQSFHYNDAPNRYGLPAYYDLHVWAWKDNPNGMFAEFNPDVSCVDYTGD